MNQLVKVNAGVAKNKPDMAGDTQNDVQNKPLSGPVGINLHVGIWHLMDIKMPLKAHLSQLDCSSLLLYIRYM
jgi:hypothetical protein